MAATSAFAQSSVTISGNVDLGYQSLKQTGITTGPLVNNGGTANNFAATERKTTAPVGNGAQGWTSSAIGIDAVEDMGNGTKAGFSAAMNLNSFGAGPDNASQLLGTGRHSYAFISDNSLGELRAGYQYTLDDQIQGGVGRATPTGNTGGRVQNFGNIGFTINPSASPINGTDALAKRVPQEAGDVATSGAVTRANGFQYNTPVFNGFQGMLQYATQGNTPSSAEANKVGLDGKADGKLQGFAGKYTNGPLTLGGSYMKLVSDATGMGTSTTTGATAVTGAQKAETKLTNLAANYDFGTAKVFYNYFKRTTDITAGSWWDGDVKWNSAPTTTTTASQNAHATSAYGYFKDGGRINRNGYDLGVSAPFGKTTLFASMGKGKYEFAQGTANDLTSADVKGRLLGATYDLSKRTSLNAYYSTTKLSAESIELKNTMVGAGLRHQF